MNEVIDTTKKTLNLYPIDYPFETLFARITAREPKTILDPDFQRKYKWDKDGWGRASQFIESCLMRIPLPSCYFAEDENYRQIVIDGVQRLTTITKFFNDEFALEGLTAFKELEGKKFSELGDFKAELESTTIRCIVLRKENPKKLIREIFARLNQGAVQLSDQEIRHAIYPGSLDSLLSELAETPEIAKFGIAENSDRTKDSREAEEQVLRFFAFAEDLRLEKYNDVLKIYLDNYMENHVDALPDEIERLRKKFISALSNCKDVFGQNLFVSAAHSTRKRQQGMAYYDLLMTTVGLLDRQIVQEKKDSIRAAYKELCEDNSFKRALSAGLQQKSSILRRRKLWGDLLNVAVSA